jgi:hypothetical protein
MRTTRNSLFLVRSTDGTAKTTGENDGKELNSKDEDGNDDQPLPLFLKVSIEL